MATDFAVEQTQSGHRKNSTASRQVFHCEKNLRESNCRAIELLMISLRRDGVMNETLGFSHSENIAATRWISKKLDSNSDWYSRSDFDFRHQFLSSPRESQAMKSENYLRAGNERRINFWARSTVMSGASSPVAKGALSAARAAAICAMVCWAGVACATAKPFNPYNIDAGRIGQVQQLCQSVMGLNPSSSTELGLWPDGPDAGVYTNPYRGCVASLSQTLLQVAASQRSVDVDRACREKGYTGGSAELATCVLDGLDRGPLSVAPLKASSTAYTADSSMQVPRHDMARKERFVCAQLGLEPTDVSFNSCVHGLNNAMIARDMDEDYKN